MPCLVDELLQLGRDIAKPSGRAERDAICPRESAVSAPSAGLVFDEIQRVVDHRFYRYNAAASLCVRSHETPQLRSRLFPTRHWAVTTRSA